MPSPFYPTIGLEIHVQLDKLSRKIFSPEGTAEALPNRSVSTVSLAFPGAMPVLNKEAVSCAIRLGLACSSRITKHNHFDRKSYTYRDLPKGYQITQQRTPICVGGHLILPPSGTHEMQVKIGLQRIHLEEDTGQSLHHLDDQNQGLVALNFNRAGIGLLEVVTEPDLHRPEEAHQLLGQIRRLVRYLGISTGRMESGALRCDANISMARQGAQELGTPVEVKNMNSMSHVQKAIAYEIKRQSKILARGGKIQAQTRYFDEKLGETLHMRKKHSALDYRYLPEPDLSPFEVDAAWISAVKAKMPLLPEQFLERFTTTYQLPPQDGKLLVEDQRLAQFYDQLCADTTHYKQAANWLLGPIRAQMNQLKVTTDQLPFTPPLLARLVNLVVEEKIAFSLAAEHLLPLLWNTPQADLHQAAQQMGLIGVDIPREQLVELAKRLLAQYPEKQKAYRAGKKGLLGFFIGELMRQHKDQADPRSLKEVVQQLLEAELST